MSIPSTPDSSKEQQQSNGNKFGFLVHSKTELFINGDTVLKFFAKPESVHRGLSLTYSVPSSRVKETAILGAMMRIATTD